MPVQEQDLRTIGTLVSVNVGEPREVTWAGRKVVTGIWKSPRVGRVPVEGVNLVGDGQADLRVHGGPDKAVYAYASEDYRWWEDQLNTELTAGTFGENLTTDGVDLTTSVVGEVWSVGTTFLRVTQPRMPCFKLGIRMGDASFVETFDEARRYGVYFSIQREGDVGAGDPIVLASRPKHGLTAASIADIQVTQRPEDMRRLRELDDVPMVWRVWADRQLRRTDRSHRHRGL
jgi:MOSC domain-containing protein YiiM